jgi:polyferredoxin
VGSAASAGGSPSTNADVLSLPIVGRFLRWRRSRLVLQLFLLGILLLVVYDGLTGPQLAPQNHATVLVWVHYRGFVMLGLLLAGNLFCSACPFTLSRSVLRRISSSGSRFPRFLRNKWVSAGAVFVLFWAYEWMDLWASPWLTAWLVVAYFGLSFALEALFKESPFCKYVCPIGAFNFTYSMDSPTRIGVSSPVTCKGCPGKECIRGSCGTLGCGTELYAPMIQSNMDCTLCLDCARACPYGNVALHARSPFAELTAPLRSHRWDLSFLLIAMTFFGLSNAFGMVSPVYRAQEWLSEALGIQNEGIRLLVLFGGLNLLLPALTLAAGSWLSRALNARAADRRLVFFGSNYARGFVPLGFGIWLAHYGFHFAIGGLTIIPVFQSFMLDHGFHLLGEPNWELSYILPQPWIFPLQILAIGVGFTASLYVLARRSLRPGLAPIDSFKEMLPWALMVVLIAIASLSIFNIPMEMRGTIFFKP